MDKNKVYSLYTGQQVRDGEVKAAKLANISMYQLMQRAGFAAYQLFTRYYAHAGNLLVICGSGNNGGDGYVVALLAKQAGYSCTVISTCETEKLSGGAHRAMLEWRAAKGQVYELPNMDEMTLDSALAKCDVVVDGILGTGLTGKVRESCQRYIEMVNRHQKPVISIDIPSGLCSDSGKILGCSIRASHTVTFIGVKLGLVTGQARDVVGELHFAGLDVDGHFSSVVDSKVETLSLRQLLNQRLPRKPTAHKGSSGRLVCIGGDEGYSGAIQMCSTAALRSGAGLVTCMTHPQSALPLRVATPEVMTIDVDFELNDSAESKLSGCDVIAIGPGLGIGLWSKQVYRSVDARDKSLVMDADALNLLAQNPNYMNQRVLTPHPGEAARLMGCSVAEIETNRYYAVKALQEKYGGVVVLKGAGTLIAEQGKIYVCLAGNPGMATGGMGDVLTGVIAALIAQGADIRLAAKLGVVVHSEAADREAEKSGKLGMLATDLIPHIRTILNFG